jgi:hypothetical protein
MITSFCVATIAYLVKRFRSTRSRAASRAPEPHLPKEE